ncbi:UDP-N-acetylmuramoyl-tripeptide--D-alanyl-D-alanine ligase [Alloscardovia theropitheci]|uniref:UDP-N-acetylmuramoyl-tripeptide--D-alanyl-D-alanine ligase n=1 Tax=Alloscardovia theropitheci TaxID=2496842 RepID=A0A4V2MTV8_9BIFI|nr:UDP-N-acetylmuramoyl-tripeptide--D-alanyl-D-alanine ligase [Alloscardovia theropitheci]TCD53969.1 UDP-N-acetylmuramoyl-tripeptide--D-alanyl-D-alanine ligase [Alloscardovia theropitheci]
MISTHVSELITAGIGQLYIDSQRIDEIPQSDDFVITSVTTDSRQSNDSSAFVAIAGEHVDGHDFVSNLSDTALAVVDHLIDGASVPQLLVEDTIKALGDIARLNIEKRKAFAARGMNEFTIIAITGSVGKTTTKDMLSTVLLRLAPTVAPQGSFNNDIGLPLTALQVDEKTRFFVAEMGASAQGEIAYLTTIAPPDISIVLKVGVAHLGGFGSVEGIRDAKSEIVRALSSSGVAILNADDENVRSMASMTKASSIIWFSRKNAQEQPKPAVSGMVSSVITRGTDTSVDDFNRPMFSVTLPDNSQFELRLGISGEHNVYNALAVLSVIYSLDIPEHIAASVLSQMTAISPHRMHIAPVDTQAAHFTVIDDSFNANPDSMRAGLNALKSFESHTEDLTRIAVLGSMLELGPTEEEAHRTIGEYAASCADIVIAVGSHDDQNLTRLAQCLADGVRKGKECESAHANEDTNAQDTTECAEHVYLVSSIDEAHSIVDRIASEKNTVVLLKGSHASGLSALASRWLGNSAQ